MTFRPPAIPDGIQWHEGMLLSPQHFQQMQARSDAQCAWHLLAAQPLAHGFRHLEIDTAPLARGVLRVVALEAVMPDGTLVAHDALDDRDGALDLVLAPHLAALQDAPLPVWLTLARSRSMRRAGAPARHRGVRDLPVDDEVSDGEPVELPRLRPALGLAAGLPPGSLWQSLRLATLVREDGLVRLVDELPPVSFLQPGHAPLRRAWALCERLRAKAAYLARLGGGPAAGTEARLARLENRARLGALLAPLASLEALLRTPRLPPLSLYLALAEALGPLALLREGTLPPQPAAWDHDRPQALLDAMLDAAEAAVAAVSQDHRLLAFDLEAGRFTRVVEPGWLQGPRLVVGLRGSSDAAMAGWMDGAMIASASSWAVLRERRVLGAARRRIDAAPELGLHAGAGHLLYEIDAASPALRAGEPLQIACGGDPSDPARPHEIVLFVRG